MDNLCTDEKEYLDRALKYDPSITLQNLDRDVLKKVVQETHDVDDAAALFYQRVISEPENKLFLDYISNKEKEIKKSYPNFASKKILFLMIPGMFYQDNPHIESSGETLRKLARKLGLKDDIVKIKQTGTVDENGQMICDYLKNNNNSEIKSIILASASKGGGDIKRAIGICGNEEYFKKIRGWFNIGGITKGSLLVNGILNNFRNRMEARIYFLFKGYNWNGLLSIRQGKDTPLDEPFVIPSGMQVVSIVGVPFFRHVTPRARPYYNFLIQFGPSDGIVMLADSYIPGGRIYPSMRNDHYFQFAFTEERMAAILSYIVEHKI
jgi:hypothetical protein